MTAKPRIRPPYKNYEENQKRILDTLGELEKEGNSFPSYRQIAEHSGLSKRTVERHYERLDFGYICEREKIHTPNVIKAIRETAHKDKKPRAQKLYAQIMETWIEKKEERRDIVGDLEINANISGELNVNVKRSIIRSREELEALQNIADAVKQKSSPGEQAGKGGEKDAHKFDDILQNVPGLGGTVIENVDTMIFFE